MHACILHVLTECLTRVNKLLNYLILILRFGKTTRIECSKRNNWEKPETPTAVFAKSPKIRSQCFFRLKIDKSGKNFCCRMVEHFQVKVARNSKYVQCNSTRERGMLSGLRRPIFIFLRLTTMLSKTEKKIVGHSQRSDTEMENELTKESSHPELQIFSP